MGGASFRRYRNVFQAPGSPKNQPEPIKSEFAARGRGPQDKRRTPLVDISVCAARDPVNSQSLGPWLSPKHTKSIVFGDMHGPKPYEFTRSRATNISHTLLSLHSYVLFWALSTRRRSLRSPCSTMTCTWMNGAPNRVEESSRLTLDAGCHFSKAPKRHIKEWHIKGCSSDPGSSNKPAKTNRKSIVGGGPAAGKCR